MDTKPSDPKPSNQGLETPSGKGADDENFPVGSWLLPKALRPHVAVFYAYARAIDDIADNPGLGSVDKIARLEAFAAALQSGSTDPALAKAEALRQSLAETGVTAKHGLDLISAFKQDARKQRYESWAELLDYCDRSAAPVGRYLLDLHGEHASLYPYADALCNALQVINHLQDCGKDYLEMDRVYLPLAWVRAENAAVEHLARPSASPGLRRVLDRALERVSTLLGEARRLPAQLAHRRLAAEGAVIVAIAERLTVKLGREDPLAHRVVLTKAGMAGTALRGLLRLWF
jgi:squalene synthase HpnC